MRFYTWRSADGGRRLQSHNAVARYNRFMKRAIIVHCWGGYSNYCWYQDVKQRLEKRGFEVTVPAMPDSDAPELSKWLPVLQRVVEEPDRELYLIGHSLGVATILRYLEGLGERERIGGMVSVAGFAENVGFDELNSFFVEPMDLERIKERAKAVVAIASDNDPYVDLKYSEELRDRLGAKLEIMHDMGHFSAKGRGGEPCVKLPEVAEAVVELAGE